MLVYSQRVFACVSPQLLVEKRGQYFEGKPAEYLFHLSYRSPFTFHITYYRSSKYYSNQ